MIAAMRYSAVMGLLVFAGLWVAVAFMPKGLEKSAVGFVKMQITADIQERYPALAPDGMNAGLQKLSDRFGLKRTQLGADIESDLPEMVAAVVSGLCGCDGRSKTEIAAGVRAGMADQIAQLGVAQSRLAEIIKGRYEAIIAALRLDLMIFLGTNALAFLGVLGVTFIGSEKKKLAIYPALLLTVSVLVSSFIYVFSTDWFFAILFQNYWGYGYLCMMAVIFGFLIDIALNRARVTLQLVQSLPNALVPIC